MAEAQQTLAILFADIAGSTQLYEKVGDVEAHRRVAESLGFMADAVSRHGGEVLRTVGDSTLASFVSCDNALLAACAMQENHKATPLAVRVGFHYGPVIPDKGDVYGNAVNIAARVASFAKTDEITATADSIANLSDVNRARATLLDTIQVKGVTEPVGIYRVTWEADETMHTQIAVTPLVSHAVSEHTEVELQHNGHIHRVDKQANALTIGRDKLCGLSIDGERISRQHAQIEWSAGQLQLSDTSTNGTFIHRRDEAPLFVRRETVVLEGAGFIGFGTLPNDDKATAVAYAVNAGEPV